MPPAPDAPARSSAAPDPVLGAPHLDPGLTRFEVLRRLRTGPRGLTEAEADDRLARYGENTVPVPRGVRGTRRLVRALRDPFTSVLLVLGGVSAVVASWGTACVITVLVVVSCVLRIQGERRADRASAALRALVPTTVTVSRRAHEAATAETREVPCDLLVPGDIVYLGPGDVVPADVRLLRSTGLTVHQRVLTGESTPVVKGLAEIPAQGRPASDDTSPPDALPAVFDHAHLCFQGGSVVSGSATAVVVATGAATLLARGHAGEEVRRHPRSTAFDRSVDGISWILIRFMLLMPPLILMANAAVRGRGLETLPFAVAVAVSMTPEMLPVIVTGALARGAGRLARDSDVIVRRLPALHDIGAMDVLCVDKTGTLTQDRPVVEDAVDAHGRPDPEVLRWAALNSWWTLHLAELPRPDPLDDAVLEAAEPDEEFEGIEALPFDPTRRIATAVVCRTGDWARHVLVVKGTVQDVLERCARVDDDRAVDDGVRHRILERAAAYADGGLRVLAVAVKTRRPRLDAYTADDERDLTFVGFLTLRDAVADTAGAALTALDEAGVAVKVLTGDHPGTAARVCRELGLDPGKPVTGPQLDTLDDDRLAEIAARTTVFARCSPEHKARVVAALRAAGHTTGFLGDGVNDLPALRAADVGICPRDAADVTRDAVDVVLAAKDLTAIDRIIAEGRRGSVNIASYLRITISSNLGNAIAMLAAGLMVPFLPMLPVQVLVQNLLFDAAQLTLAYDRPPAGALHGPTTLRPDRFLRFAGVFGALNAAADIAMFGLLAWTTDGASAFRSGWFTENLLTQALVLIALRTGRQAAIGSCPRPVLLAACGLAVVGVALPHTPLAPGLGMVPLPPSYYALLAVVIGVYAVALVAVRRRFG
ncbi:magnesium-translocating P-type ATPase [Yinghuangia sp. ASG 101]|uniref:magnesium-translocating P-type ATPase n=1 Tax=Yinghuangia sp. ASG 101 TaxID=2896848 RepID=UPI001E3CCE4A|nr:magnesium-translocating P-type ATPase [Yinghuangia sp. ASG 101]UGQ11578.1 magnesium-translocating P-type ATPase [Yinghuangia sp. ASG 101]